jgi:hypothetical protein
MFISYRFLLRIRSFISRRRRLRKCLGMLYEIQNSAVADPGERINICYRLARELLEISGLNREKNMELFNYGVSLKKIDYNLSKDVLGVFFIYSKTSYSSSSPSMEDAELSSQRIIKIKNNLANNLKLI